MNDMQLKKAKEIIEKILYITLATSSKEGMPWNSPVYAAFDDQYNFFWKSAKNSQHSQNIKENNTVFIVIYDSTVPWGEGKGVYIQAKAFEITDEQEIADALAYHNKRVGKDLWKSEEFTGENPRRVYKAVPESVWMNKESEENGKFVDIRQEITLESLKNNF